MVSKIDIGNMGIEELELYRKYKPFRNLYEKCMSEGVPQIEIHGGKEKIRIYRGLTDFDGTPNYQLYEDDINREVRVLNLLNPGIDWSPIRAFADSYINKNAKKYALLSAWIHTDIQEILEATIKDNESLNFYDWGSYESRPIKSLKDALMIVVPETSYHYLDSLEVIASKGKFRIIKNPQKQPL